MSKEEIQIPTIPPETALIQDLLKQSAKLAKSGKSSEALSILDRAETSSKSDKEIKDNDRNLLLSRIQINRGIIFKNMRSLVSSARCYEEAMELLDGLEDIAPREIFSAELNLAILRMRLRERKKALVGFENSEIKAKKFPEPDRSDLLTKVLTNQAQLHLEFHEIDKARELLDRIMAAFRMKNKSRNREKHARITAQLGQLIAQIADKLENRQHADEHYNQSLRFFDEARKTYDDLELTRDALSQTINFAEVLISLDRSVEAAKDLENVYARAVDSKDKILAAKAASKLFIISILFSNQKDLDKWLGKIIEALSETSTEARSDILESLETRLRWLGDDRYIKEIQKLRGEGLN